MMNTKTVCKTNAVGISGYPIAVETEEEMLVLLSDRQNAGKVYLFVGEDTEHFTQNMVYMAFAGDGDMPEV